MTKEAETPVVFTCHRCGQIGNPPPCDHFAHAWSLERIAEAHKELKAMAETPDFDQMVLDLAVRAARGDILPHIKEALRQVWQAGVEAGRAEQQAKLDELEQDLAMRAHFDL